jgi:hypothetical protein
MPDERTKPPPVAGTPIVTAAPARERTVLGVGAPAPPVARPTAREPSAQEPPPEDWDLPGAHDAPTRENAVPQRGAPVVREQTPSPEPAARPEAPPQEPSIAIDLVAKKPAAEVDTSPPPPVPRRRGRWLVLLLLVIALAAATLYVMRGRLPWVQRLVETWTTNPH